MTRSRTFSVSKGVAFEVVDPDGRVVATGRMVHRPGHLHQAVAVECDGDYSVRVAVPEPTYWPREMLEPPMRDWQTTRIDNRRKESE